MRIKNALFLSAVLLFGAMGCGLLDSVVNQAVSGGKPAGTVADLWSDVPKMDGMNKVNMDLPIAAQVAIKAMAQGNFDFIAYTTNKTPADVTNYYTADRMKSTGWSSDSGGCSAGGGSSGSAGGGICIFEQTVAGKDTALIIFIGQDDKTKQTELFFIRVTQVGTPTK